MNEIFTRALLSFSSVWANQFGATPIVKWPLSGSCIAARTCMGVSGGVETNDQMARCMVSSQDAVGYTDLQRAVRDGLPMLRMINKVGRIATPM